MARVSTALAASILARDGNCCRLCGSANRDDSTGAALPTGAALRDKILREASSMARAFLGRLFAAYPDALAKGEILRQVGYASSGPVSKTFAHLVAIGYAEKQGAGQLRAAAVLFE